MAKLSNFELGCQIFWSTTIDPDECNLADTGNPESCCIAREAYEKLTAETKLMLTTIINLPDEMFLASGRLIQRELISWMKRRYGWDKKQIDKSRAELLEAFGERI